MYLIAADLTKMIKTKLSYFVALPLVALMSASANAQWVTSYYAPQIVAPAAPVTYAPTTVVAPAVAAPIMGTIPVRSGLFGLRTNYVPVLAGTPIVAPVVGMATVARPVVTAYSVPYTSARPIVSTTPTYNNATYYTSGTALSLMNPAFPNAVVQSGYRGASPFVPITPAPVYAVPTATYPAIAAPYNSFYPGAVMTMQ